MSDKARETFVARFGEDQAVAIETAVAEHQTNDGVFRSVHAGDNVGSQPFRYVFLSAIGSQCVDEYADAHGITVPVEDMRAWAVDPTGGDLAHHDGDIPDFLALLCGAYEGWVETVREEN